MLLLLGAEFVLLLLLQLQFTPMGQSACAVPPRGRQHERGAAVELPAQHIVDAASIIVGTARHQLLVRLIAGHMPAEHRLAIDVAHTTLDAGAAHHIGQPWQPVAHVAVTLPRILIEPGGTQTRLLKEAGGQRAQLIALQLHHLQPQLIVEQAVWHMRQIVVRQIELLQTLQTEQRIHRQLHNAAMAEVQLAQLLHASECIELNAANVATQS